jgi:hypothetical protein
MSGWRKLVCSVYRHDFQEPAEQAVELQAALDALDICHPSAFGRTGPRYDLALLVRHKGLSAAYWAGYIAQINPGHGDQDCCNAERFHLDWLVSIAVKVCTRCGAVRKEPSDAI